MIVCQSRDGVPLNNDITVAVDARLPSLISRTQLIKWWSLGFDDTFQVTGYFKKSNQNQIVVLIFSSSIEIFQSLDKSNVNLLY